MNMSDGGRQSARDDEKRRASTGGDGLGLAISRVAVALLCESTGFQSIQCSALDVLSDVAVRYMYNVGISARFFANLSGRTECNAIDVLQSLGELGSVVGFADASDLHHRCVVGSGVIRDIAYYLSTAEEVPFCRRVLSFPLVGSRIKAVPISSFAQCGQIPPGAHIPDWLPAFPPNPLKCDHSSVENTQACAAKLERNEQRRKEAPSVLALKKWLAGKDGNMAVLPEVSDFGKGRQSAADGNPFLAPPLPFGEKQVSRLDFEEWAVLDKHVRGLQAFAPATEAAKNGALDIGDGDKKVLLSTRPTVHFRLGSGKRPLRSSFLVGTDVFGKPDLLFLGDEENNDKKQRNELVLGEFLESTGTS